MTSRSPGARRPALVSPAALAVLLAACLGPGHADGGAGPSFPQVLGQKRETSMAGIEARPQQPDGRLLGITLSPTPSSKSDAGEIGSSVAPGLRCMSMRRILLR